jgi:hypothetical protein
VHAVLRLTTLLTIFLAIGLAAGCDSPQDRGVIAGAPLPTEVVEDRLDRQRQITNPNSTDEQKAAHHGDRGDVK